MHIFNVFTLVHIFGRSILVEQKLMHIFHVHLVYVYSDRTRTNSIIHIFYAHLVCVLLILIIFYFNLSFASKNALTRCTFNL